MHNEIDNYLHIKDEIKTKLVDKKLQKIFPTIVVVTKTHQKNKFLPLIKNGHLHFGENKVQEAIEKWTIIKAQNKNIKLHMIGKLQTNKVKQALTLFDYIHSLDNLKLADKINKEQIKLEVKPKIFIQVNIGNEEQKNGVITSNVKDFYQECVEKFNLNIIGLMCIPPISKNAEVFFEKMNEINKSLNLKELSMGMSDDYFEAIKYGSTYVRIGSKIFGSRS